MADSTPAKVRFFFMIFIDFAGDSGGPLICPIDGKATLMGVVSRGQGCASEGYPGIYSNVHFALEWISATIEEDSLFDFL